MNPVLVVDDEEANRDLLSRRLRRVGFGVETASNGREALDLVRSRPFELVLLDSMMPGMSGVELLALLRGTYSQSELPVIMVTAFTEAEKIAEALSMGANDYVTKPIDFVVALARIRSQLNRKRAEDALRESEERYSLAARGTNDGLWDWDLRTGKVYYSPRWKEMLGCQAGEIGDSPEEWLSRVHADERPSLVEHLDKHCAGGGPDEFSSEYRMLHKDGTWRWMLSRGVVSRSPAGKALRMAGSQTDITNSKVRDSLTGLPNRTLFLEALERCADRHREAQGEPFAILFLDLDRFKNINDSLGHFAGDQMLIEVARRLDSVVRCSNAEGRPADVVARLGGDEFAILLAAISSIEDAISVARRIQAVTATPVRIDSHDVHTTASIGIAFWNDSYRNSLDLLRDADTAMYRAKSAGKARYAVFDAEMRAQAVLRLELENDLRCAIAESQFVVYYQPKVELRTGRLVGFEALVRWQHSVRGMLMPAEFIPIAEETGLIVPVGEIVLEEACRTMHAWNADYGHVPPLEVSVNVSPRQFRDPGLVESIRRILDRTGFPATSLKLEITESVLIDDPPAALAILEQLRSMHIGLKIDDFGTGYSSLSYLTHLPCDCLKIDRSFVFNMFQDRHSLEIIRAIIGLAQTLGMEVVAEGIENLDQLDRLKSLGCVFGQGYYFAKPLCPADVSSLLERGQTYGHKQL